MKTYGREGEKGAEEGVNELQFFFLETIDFIRDCNDGSLVNTWNQRYLYHIAFKDLQPLFKIEFC